MNLWYLACVLFCVYNLLMLINKRKSVIFDYKISESKDFANSKYSVCMNISELIEKEELKNEIHTPKQMVDALANSLLSGNENNIILNSSFIQQGHVCIAFILDNFNQIFRNISSYRFKLLTNPSNQTQIHFILNIYTHNQLKEENFLIGLRPIIISLLSSPFETNCTLIRPENDKATKNYMKLDCLTDCYKLYANLTYLYYNYDEDVELNLNENEWKLILNDYCLNKCRFKDCSLILYNKYISYEENSDDLPEIEITYFSSIIAKPLLSLFDVIIQFISLIVLFVNISLFEIFIFAIKISKNKLRNRRKTLISLNCLAFSICILLFSASNAYYIVDFLKFYFFGRSYFTDSKEFMPFSAFLCLPVQLAYLNKSDQLTFEKERIFAKKTVLKNENYTSFAFKDLSRNSYLKRGGLKVPFRIEIEKDILFKNEHFLQNSKEKLLSRCFRIDIDIVEYKYQNSLSFTQLVLDLKYFDFKIFFTDFKHTLTSNHLHTDKKVKIIIVKNKLLEYPYELNCKKYTGKGTSRDDFTDRCYNQKFYKNYSSVSTESVIYKSHFDKLNLSNTYFNRDKKDEPVCNYCSSLYKNRDCKRLKFFNRFQLIELSSNELLKNK